MKAEIKGRWLKALRSGDYAQAQHQLRVKGHSEEYGYCCLGVLCDLAAKDGVGAWRRSYFESGVLDDPNIPNDISDAVLPAFVQEWAGVDSNSPNVVVENDEGVPTPTGLAELNDNGRDFNTIADLIEDQL